MLTLQTFPLTRRRVLGSTAMTVLAGRLGMTGSAHAKTTQETTMTIATTARDAAQDTAAERLFEVVLPRLHDRDRERIRDLDWVLEGPDRSAYARLAETEALDFQRRFWILADPLFLTPGNESWAEHVSRHVWSRILARAPVVGDMVRWGEDLEQLTVRYGVPVARTRTPGTMSREGTLVEHYDPDQLVFTPPELLSRGLPPTPLPGRPWELDRRRARSGFAPGTVSRVVALDHQVTRFPVHDGVLLRLDGRVALDSTAAVHVASPTVR